MQAYAALGGQDGSKAKWKLLGGKLLESDPVVDIAKRLSETSSRSITSAQVLLRYALERNCSIVPKTSSVDRMKENTEIFDFTLTNHDMKALSCIAPNIEGDGRICWRTEPLRMLDF